MTRQDVAALDPSTNRISLLRVRLGTELQKHRLRRGLTQSQVAEFVDLSLKYVGEIERGEANTTLDVLERLAAAVGWDPLVAMEGARESISEGVRLLLIAELEQMQEVTRTMTKWLKALDPMRHPDARLPPVPPTPAVDPKRRPRGRRRRQTNW